MKILALDVETRPNLAYVWGLFNQNVSLNQLHTSGEMFSWGAKFVGEPNSTYQDGDYRQDDWLERLHALLCEADAVLGHNVKAFDMKHIRASFLTHNLPPIPNHTFIDTLTIARRNFKFPSNKLDYLAQTLLNKRKRDTGGFELWVKCLANDPVAWKKMLAYQKQDVLLLEPLYKKLKAWDSSLNHNPQEHTACPSCAGTNFKKAGTLYTAQGTRRQRYQCLQPKCGRWFSTSTAGKVHNR